MLRKRPIRSAVSPKTVTGKNPRKTIRHYIAYVLFWLGAITKQNNVNCSLVLAPARAHVWQQKG